MTHDITHCCNETCKDKDTCLRYLAFLELKRIRYEYPVSMLALVGTDKNQCTNYWEVTNEDDKEIEN